MLRLLIVINFMIGIIFVSGWGILVESEGSAPYWHRIGVFAAISAQVALLVVGVLP